MNGKRGTIVATVYETVAEPGHLDWEDPGRSGTWVGRPSARLLYRWPRTADAHKQHHIMFGIMSARPREHKKQVRMFPEGW